MPNPLLPDDPVKAFVAGWLWGVVSALFVLVVWRICALARRVDKIAKRLEQDPGQEEADGG